PAKTHENRNLVVGSESYRVLTAERGVAEARLSAIHRKHLKFLKMNVDGMRPLRALIAERPYLRAALADLGVRAVGVEKPAIDEPSSVQIIEFPETVVLDLSK